VGRRAVFSAQRAVAAARAASACRYRHHAGARRALHADAAG